MMQTIEANWVAFAVALLAVLVVGWLLLRRATSRPARREYKPDVLDQGAASVPRNQALIDAAPAAQIVTPPPMAGTLGGIGEVIAVAAQDAVEEAEARIAEVPEVPVAPEESRIVSRGWDAASGLGTRVQLEPSTDEVYAAPPPPPAPAPEVEPAPPAPSPPAPEPEIEPAPAPAVEPAPQPEIVPSTEPIPAPSAPTAQPSGGADDLSRIKGLGPKLQALLPTLGLTTYAQIAALSEADLADLDGKLGPFAGRPAKDNWVEQAKYLAKGDVSGFEERFGKV
ncbi:MAG: hypothetical protein ACKOPE_00410 [Novosphingobium sp.]